MSIMCSCNAALAIVSAIAPALALPRHVNVAAISATACFHSRLLLPFLSAMVVIPIDTYRACRAALLASSVCRTWCSNICASPTAATASLGAWFPDSTIDSCSFRIAFTFPPDKFVIESPSFFQPLHPSLFVNSWSIRFLGSHSPLRRTPARIRLAPFWQS